MKRIVVYGAEGLACKHEIINKFSNHDLVIGFQTEFEKDKICDACHMGKQTKASSKSKKYISTYRHLELLHMDLFEPARHCSQGGKRYIVVVVDNYTRFTRSHFCQKKVKL